VPVGFIFWGELDPRMLLLVGIFSIFIEFGLLLRRRSEMACPHCGFDPVIYKQNPDRACAMVIAHLKTRGEDPRAWMGHRPPIKLPVRRNDKAEGKPKSSGKSRSLDLTL